NLKMNRSTILIISFILLCGSGFSAEKVRVFVSIAPQAAFVEKVAGERATVNVLVQPGESPTTYSPSPRQMVELARCDIFFHVGVPFENGFIPKIQNSMPNVKIVDTRKGIELRELDAVRIEEHNAADEHEHGHDDHEHGHDNHEHGPTDPHIWLDPILVKQQAATMADALIAQDPAGEAVYKKNLEAFHKELEALDKEMRKTMKDLNVRNIFVFHPAYGYFCDRYDIEQIAVELQGKEPKGRELAQFIKMAREQNARVIFVQPQFSDTAARAIARAIDGTVISLDPLARDYMDNLRGMAAKVKKALENTNGEAEAKDE
ncbi:MAG: metal ABC transporter solute-binding protein, Zn/Mn family, partial [Candidatus Sumerlaeota bacterium]